MRDLDRAVAARQGVEHAALRLVEVRGRRVARRPRDDDERRSSTTGVDDRVEDRLHDLAHEVVHVQRVPVERGHVEGLLEEQLELALGLGRHGAVRHVEARGVVRQRPQAPGLEVPAAQGPLEGRREVAALLARERHEAADLARDLLAVVLGVALVARARVAALKVGRVEAGKVPREVVERLELVVAQAVALAHVGRARRLDGEERQVHVDDERLASVVAREDLLDDLRRVPVVRRHDRHLEALRLPEVGAVARAPLAVAPEDVAEVLPHELALGHVDAHVAVAVQTHDEAKGRVRVVEAAPQLVRPRRLDEDDAVDEARERGEQDPVVRLRVGLERARRRQRRRGAGEGPGHAEVRVRVDVEQRRGLREAARGLEAREVAQDGVMFLDDAENRRLGVSPPPRRRPGRLSGQRRPRRGPRRGGGPSSSLRVAVAASNARVFRSRRGPRGRGAAARPRRRATRHGAAVAAPGLALRHHGVAIDRR